MKIALLAFASAGDIVGAAESVLDLPARTTLGDLKTLLERRHPELAGLWPRIAVAINGDIRPDDTALGDGDEVAILPPVSGGSGAPARAAEREAERPVLTDGELDVGAVVSRVASASCGAVVVFTGTVRDSHRGRPVERITYSAYRAMADTRIRTIAERLEQRFPGSRVAIVHRLGEIAVGVASVVIAVASPHREAAYAASREALERLKTEVPIWKREHYAGGESRWREEESLVGGVGNADHGAAPDRGDKAGPADRDERAPAAAGPTPAATDRQRT